MHIDIDFRAQNTAHIRLYISQVRLVIATLLIYLFSASLVCLFMNIYFHEPLLLKHFYRLDNIIAALINTFLIVVLGLAFLVIKLWKRSARIKRKSVWRILVIHVLVVASEYLILYAVIRSPQLSTLSVIFQIVTVGLARGICVDSWVFKFERYGKEAN
ncbi:lysylphosphatidylglycerol synthetase-like protein (DUF2156 family) [Filimonas zeae]|nr:lysylphosphatidylglycerol synthetase-like protein (DUF2156 family) [Filimonas zeae]